MSSLVGSESLCGQLLLEEKAEFNHCKGNENVSTDSFTIKREQEKNH